MTDAAVVGAVVVCGVGGGAIGSSCSVACSHSDSNATICRLRCLSSLPYASLLVFGGFRAFVRGEGVVWGAVFPPLLMEVVVLRRCPVAFRAEKPTVVSVSARVLVKPC